MPDTDPDDDLSIGERLSQAARMNQEPKDRLWAAIYVLVVITLLVGAITVFYAESNKNYVAVGRALGYERGAIDCQQVVLDNERVSGLPGYCGKVEVRVFFPPEVCAEFFPHTPDCGDKWVEAGVG